MFLSETNQDYSHFSRMMFQMFDILLQSDAGCLAIQESKFIEELISALGKAENKTSVFNKENLLRTLSLEYFKIIGLFSHHPKGVAILSKTGLHNALKAIAEWDSREQLVTYVLRCMDYNQDIEARNILKLILKADDKNHKSPLIRFYAVKHLGILYENGTKDFASKRTSF